ncbi:MAG: hypothetical protein QM483_04010 [Desulfuromusa sp.]
MVATKEQYKQALKGLRDGGHLRNSKYLDLIKAQHSSEKHTITATNLAKAAGYKNYNAANLQYGTMAKIVAGHLGYMPPKRANGDHMWWCTLSDGNMASDETMDGHFEFVMHPELVEALEEMRWAKPIS